MNKKSQFLLIVLILIFGAGIASANTLFLKQEWKTLENWDKNKTTNNIGNTEGYREPEDMKLSENKSFNTLFTKAESNILENWNQEKTLNFTGQEIVCKVNCVPGVQ